MVNRDLVLNTIAFIKEIDKGTLQENLISKTAAMGFDGIEIRSEFLKDEKSEPSHIRRTAESKGMKVYYSVGDTLLKDGKINARLDAYVTQAKQMGAVHMKFNIGTMENYHGDLAEDLKALLVSDVQIDVENDQTTANSSLKNIQRFFALTKEKSLNIGFCFDIANWCWIGEKPEEAAEALAPLTRYLHLKNQKRQGEKLKTVPLLEGDIDWRGLLKRFPEDIPIGLEYPGNMDSIEAGLQVVKIIENRHGDA